MGRIVYALSGQGRGHTSRVLAIASELRSHGHEIIFCCGGTAREILESRDEPVIPVPTLRQVIENNEVRHFRTAACNVNHIIGLPKIVSAIEKQLEIARPDLLITDFEAFSPKAAARLGIPVLSFNHQQVVTETVYELPLRHLPAAKLTSLVIRLIAPRDPLHILITSFFFRPLKRPDRASLIPPVIRPEVQALTPTEGDYVLVYFNQTEGANGVIDALSKCDARFVVYNFDTPSGGRAPTNIVFKEPSIAGFADDLAQCRAVICTAGFTLMSEALFLGKPLLVVPNRGIFEQTINALFLERSGLGAAVIDRPLEARDVSQFIAKIDAHRARMDARNVLGNDDAVQCIEHYLKPQSSRNGVPNPAPGTNGKDLTAPASVAKAE